MFLPEERIVHQPGPSYLPILTGLGTWRVNVCSFPSMCVLCSSDLNVTCDGLKEHYLENSVSYNML